MMYLSELRQLAQRHGLREIRCRACPPEDWAPACVVCDGSTRAWSSGEQTLSDAELARLDTGQDRAA